MDTAEATSVRLDSAGDTSIGGSVAGRDIITYNVNVIRDGLGALGELMRAPTVRSDVIIFRNDIQKATDQIDLLSDYKELHDLLHQMEFECFNLLTISARDFPSDDANQRRSLVECQSSLDRIVGQMQAVVARAHVAKNAVIWVQPALQLPEDMDTALLDRDKTRLDKVIRALRRIIDLQPSQINTRLNETAGILSRLDLVDSLQGCATKFAAEADLDQDKVKLFNDGVRELTAISQALLKQVDDHGCWQAVQAILNRIAGSLELGTEELVESFPELRQQVEALCHDRPDRSAQALLKLSEKLAAALAEGHPGRISDCFLLYNAKVGGLFYQADVNLRSLCGELRKVGEPLASILRMAE